jgi:hypothetical protein
LSLKRSSFRNEDSSDFLTTRWHFLTSSLNVQAAIIRFTGHLVNDRPLRLETIIDYEYRVRVPEKLVLYTVGESKKTRDGTRNTMRMAQNSRELPKREKKDRRSKPSSRTDHPQDRDRGKKKKFQRKQNRKRNNDLSSWSM